MEPDRNFDKQKLLGKSPIFEALNSQARQELASFSYIKRFAAGDTIFNMGSPGLSMIAIAEGSVRISILTPGAREITLNDMLAGDVFGEIAVLDGKERSATAKALTNCTLVFLDRRSLLDVLQRKPDLSIKLIELLCKRVRRSDERMVETAFLELPVRLAKLLLKLTETADGKSDKPSEKLSHTQSELAKMIGNTRENVNRCLRKWQKEDLIKLKDGWLIICDRSALETISSDF